MALAPRRRRRRWLITALALLAGPFFAEALLRWLLFSESDLAQRLGAKYRRPGLYVHCGRDPEYSALQFLCAPPSERWQPGNPHPELGWVGPDVDPATLGNADEGRVGARRPVLLYGSSFGQCSVLATCFQDLLERSELGKRFALLNFAASAYGIDQAVLLLRRTVDAYAALDPIVVLSFTVESDLDRAMTSFYNAPKPRFERRGADFVLVPPDAADSLAFLERHPPVRSYFLAYLVHGLGVLPDSTRRSLAGEDERLERERELWQDLIASTAMEQERAGRSFFVLLFHRADAYRPGAGRSEDERLVAAFLDRAGIARVETRPDVERALERGETLADLYLAGVPGEGHPSERGTEILFDALARGLAGRFDAPIAAER